MAESSPTAAALQNPDIDPTLTNGLAQQTQQAPAEQPADVEMADSGAVPAVSIYTFSPYTSPPQNTTNTHQATHTRRATRANPAPTNRHALAPTQRANRAANTDSRHTRTTIRALSPHSTYTHTSVVAQLTASDCASAHATHSARQSDEGVLESACDAASARGDEASCYDRAGEAVEVAE
jgi:hypothetical protein